MGDESPPVADPPLTPTTERPPAHRSSFRRPRPRLCFRGWHWWGVTDALLLRRLGYEWRSRSASTRIVDALTIVLWQRRVGSPAALHAELRACGESGNLRLGPATRRGSRAAGLAERYAQDSVRCFINHPTLEPALTPGNEAIIAAALVSVGLPVPAQVDQVSIDALFHEGAGRRSKGEFAFALALTLENPPHPVRVPAHISDLFEFLYAGHAVVGAEVDNDAAPAAD